MKRNLKLKNLLVFVFAMSFIFGLSIQAEAQRKRKRTRTVPKTTTSVTDDATLKKGAEDVGIQVKNVTKFVFILGGVAKGIEDIDKDIRDGKASREVADKNAQFKADVLRSVRALRAGLVKLEVDFRTKDPLKKYLVNIQGLTQQTYKAEDLAGAGQFTESGKQLLLVVETLTDTLVAMP
jgi:hypothetical protein